MEEKIEIRPLKILVVDDDPYTLKLFKRLFHGVPHATITLKLAENGVEARKHFRENDFNLVLMDQRLPDGHGLDILKAMRKKRPDQLAILITGYADIRVTTQAVREGVYDCLTKPFKNLETLESVIEKALELDRAYREIKALRRALNEKKNI